MPTKLKSKGNPKREGGPAPRPLTAKQKQFVAEYLTDLNAAGAYRRAGYKCKTDLVAQVEGHRTLRLPKVASAIQAAMAERSQRVQVTQDYVLRGLLREAEAKGSPSARVRALQLLGQHLAMFPTTTTNTHIHTPLRVEHEVVTDATRLERLAELARRVRERRLGPVDGSGAAGVRPADATPLLPGVPCRAAE